MQTTFSELGGVMSQRFYVLRASEAIRANPTRAQARKLLRRKVATLYELV
jgi:hypothetical protein